MLPWYYDKKELRKTPSSLEGIKYETECQYRKDGARFIIETGNRMDLGYVTMATGVTYFHRFYMIHSFNTFPKYMTACACLFLAGKVEETPKKCKDIIKMAERFLSEEEFISFGPDPRGEVIILERIILQTIRFDLTVDHPYEFLLRYAKCLKGDRAKMEKMLQMAWTFVNDSLCTTLCLQWEPEIIAIAMLYLAAKLSKYEIKDWAGKQRGHNHWWDIFVMGVTLELMEDICHQVLDLYSQKKAAAEQAQAQALAAAAAAAKTEGAKVEVTTPNKDHVKTKTPVMKSEPSTLSSKLLPPPALPTDLEALAVAPPPIIFEPQPVNQSTIPVITTAGHSYFPSGSTPVPTMFPYTATPDTGIMPTYASTPSNFQPAPPNAGYQVGSSFGTPQTIVPPPTHPPPPPPPQPSRYNSNNSVQSPRYPHSHPHKSPHHFNSPTRAPYHHHSSRQNYRQAPYSRPRPPSEHHHRSKHYYPPRRW